MIWVRLPGANVSADGKPTQGTSNREKILAAKVPNGAVAITAADFIKQCSPSSAGREWKKKYKVFYIYSNHIDEGGEASADNLPAATERAFEEIETVLKKISTINGRNAIVTSDHGYLAQMSALSPTSFLADGKVEGDDDKSTRRFVLGKNLQGTAGAMSFSASELGLEGDYEVAIPKNILRLRKRGNDGRFAHGGMSLQELVIPVLEVKLRQAKSKHAVAVDIKVTAIPERVTTGQVQVVLYQSVAVGQGSIPARVSAGFFSSEGEPLTSLQALTFDSTSAEPREREQRVGFLFNRLAADYSGQTVYFRVYDSQESKTELVLQARQLINHPVQMYVSFTSDFDM